MVNGEVCEVGVWGVGHENDTCDIRGDEERWNEER